MDERPIGAAHPLVAHAVPSQVVDVAAVLAVDAHRHAGQHRRHLAFQRGEVARVHDRRAPLAEQPVEPRVELDPMAGRLVQRDEFDVVATNALRKCRRHLRQRHDRMPVRAGRHVVDQVDDAVLEAAGVEAVDDVDDQWRQRLIAGGLVEWREGLASRPHALRDVARPRPSPGFVASRA